MSQLSVWQEVDEERRGLLQNLPIEQSKSQRKERQVSTNTFTQKVAHMPKQVESTIEKEKTELIKEKPSSKGQQAFFELKSHHSPNILSNFQSPSQETKTDEKSQSVALSIQKATTQQQISRKALLQRIEQRDKFEKQRQLRRKEFRAKIRNQIIRKNQVHLKYLEDKRQERRRAREARDAEQSQRSFMDIVRKLFNLSNQDKKTQ